MCMFEFLLRQEIDGPQIEQFLLCGQKFHNSRMMEEGTSLTTHVQKDSLEVKMGEGVTS